MPDATFSTFLVRDSYSNLSATDSDLELLECTGKSESNFKTGGCGARFIFKFISIILIS
jgi:hypothetical protein